MRAKLIAAVAALLPLALATGADAHHSFQMFALDKLETVNGTVKSFRWAMPHAWITVTLPGKAGGAPEEWGFEGHAPNLMARKGWKFNTLKPGDKVTILMHPMKPLLPFLPLAAKQILLNNFLSDLPSIAISSDRVDEEQLATPQHWDVHDLRRFMLVFGLTSTLFDLLTFWLLLKVFDAPEPVFQTAWFVVSLLTELAVLLVLRTHRPAWSSRPGTGLWMTALGVAVLALALPFVPSVAGLFGLVALPPGLLGSMVLVVLGYVAATEFVKQRYHARPRAARRRRARRPAHGRAHGRVHGRAH